MNIVEPILFNARMNPAAMAICTPGAAPESVSYGQLARMIDNVARAALSCGLVRGNVVAIYVANKIFHAALVLGLARVGIVSVSARSPSLPQELGVSAIITEAAAPFQNTGRTIIANSFLWTMEGNGQPLADTRLYDAADEELCRIILSSGTTGEVKGVAFTHGAAPDRVARYSYVHGYRLPYARRVFSDLGISTGPGFWSMINLLWKGGTIFLYGADPFSTFQALDLYQVEVLSTSPNGLAEYSKFYEEYTQFQCPFDHIVFGGSRVSKALLERVSAHMCPDVFSTYGCTEVGSIAVASAAAIADISGAVGYVVPGAVVEIVDEDEQLVPAGHEGSVRIRDRFNIGGYFGEPARGAGAFRQGWFYPGDVGCLTADRMLIIAGRENTVLNLGGDKIKPEVVEEALGSFPGIEQAAVFTRADEQGVPRMWAAIVSRPPVDERALRIHCQQKLGGAFTPVGFAAVDSLPRNEMGKVDRNLLPEIVARQKS